MNFYTHKIQLLLCVILTMTFGSFNIKLDGQCDCDIRHNGDRNNITTIIAKKLHQILFPDEDPLFRQFDVYVGNDVTVISVLSKEAHDECHIPKSINIPLNQLQSTVSDWHRGKEIIVYGNGSSDSNNAFSILTNMGFKKVYAYQGGMDEWRSDYPEHLEGRCAN